ncbi:neurotrophin 1-like isoform X1 [Procambarus clarkii]|uniref:neurotrophin 1-like isoform X1 n=1 Tax=Procambarus clarkii TaxID=6728 RepID=UPI0037443EA6
MCWRSPTIPTPCHQPRPHAGNHTHALLPATPTRRQPYPRPATSHAHTQSLILACATMVLGSVHPPPYGQQPAYSHTVYKNSYCDPTAIPACAANSTLTYCLKDAEYPEYDIKGAISADFLFVKKYADVASQSADDLVDMVTKTQEEAFSYSYYTGASTGKSPYDVTHWAGPEGYICPSDVAYAMPKRAQNVEGKWRVIVNNVHYYTQTARLETCLFPEAACRALAPCYKSHCTQKYVYHRLLSFDPCDAYKGLFIDIYKLPSACSCHIPA